MTSAAPRPAKREGLTTVEIDGEAVVYDELAGDLHHLNRSATIVLSLCDGTLTIEDMAAAVAEALDVPIDETLLHVRAAVERFADAGLLT